MTRRDDAGRISLDPIALWASALVVVAMAALYWHFSGPIFADWIGYSQLWDNDGGWLLREGRDPLFVSLLHQSRRLFGQNGYGEFRFALFAVFAAVGARLAYLMRAEWVSVLFVVPIVISAFMLKSLVQIREGLAFLIVVLPLISVFRPKGGGVVHRWNWCDRWYTNARRGRDICTGLGHSLRIVLWPRSISRR
jgi:hypothetical protein